jgi:hypothetical protein
MAATPAITPLIKQINATSHGRGRIMGCLSIRGVNPRLRVHSISSQSEIASEYGGRWAVLILSEKAQTEEITIDNGKSPIIITSSFVDSFANSSVRRTFLTTLSVLPLVIWLCVLLCLK